MVCASETISKYNPSLSDNKYYRSRDSDVPTSCSGAESCRSLLNFGRVLCSRIWASETTGGDTTQVRLLNKE